MAPKSKPAPAQAAAETPTDIDLDQVRAELEKGPASAAAKIGWIAQHVGAVDKTGSVTFKNVNFKHMQEHGLLQVLRPLWRALGLSVRAGLAGPDSYSKQGNSGIVVIKLTAVCMKSGDEVVEYFVNEGIDNADKAFNKAYTGAVKYALQKMFLVPTEGIDDNETVDIENTRSTAPSPAAVQAAAARRADPSQTAALRETIKASHLENAQVGNQLTARYGVSSMDNLSPEQFAEFSAWVAAQIAGQLS